MAQIEISKKEFERLYLSMTDADLAKKLGVHRNTIVKYGKKLNISKGSGYQHSEKKQTRPPKFKIID